MKRSSLILFFVLAFLFSWVVWFSARAEAQGQLSFHIPGAFAFIGLSLAAVIAAFVDDGFPGFRDLISRWVRWRVGPLWYGVALLLTALLALVAIGLRLPFGLESPIGVAAGAGAALSYFLFQLPLFLVTEETAWRGFALPRLQTRMTALYASLLLGFIWGIWHTPLFLTPGTFQSTLSYPGFVLSAMATSVMHTWIFNHTRGSVLLAAIFHAATDTSILYLGVMSAGGALFWTFVLVQWLAVALIVWRAGASHLARSADLRETTYPPFPYDAGKKA